MLRTIICCLLFLSSSMLFGAEPAATLPGDRYFEQGFQVKGTKRSDPVRLINAQGQDDSTAKTVWGIGQWHSQGKLDKIENEGDTLRLSDDYKSLTINRKTGAFNMVVCGEKEYAEGPRTDKSAPWVHLLLNQGDTMKTPMLHTLDRLVVELEFELTEYQAILAEPPRHLTAAQFQLFLYLKGIDRDTLKPTKNFTWFGISMFDNRRDFSNDYAARDVVSQQFIYIIGSKHTLTEKVEIGKRMRIEVDVLPYVKKGLEAAHERGFMVETDYENAFFSGMNIGWEVPGVFNCGMTVHKFIVTPHPK